MGFLIAVSKTSLNIVGSDGDILAVANAVNGLSQVKALSEVVNVDIDGFSPTHEQALRKQIMHGQKTQDQNQLVLPGVSG